MRYASDYVLLNADGTPAEDDGKDATALEGLRRALITDTKQFSADQKAKRFALWSKLGDSWAEGEFELDAGELATALEAIEIYPTLVYGQLAAFLNQK